MTRASHLSLDHTMAEPNPGQAIEATFRKNSASNYTEEMTRLSQNFDYDKDSDTLWLPEVCSLFYGSEFYHQASEGQRLALNHLYWVCFYNMVAGAETSATVWNEVAAGAFFHLDGYDTICLELDLETTQERKHIAAFRTVAARTETALFGEIIFRREQPHFTQAATQHPQSRGRTSVRKHIPGHLLSAAIGSSPFVATQYFTGRGLRNVAGRIKEGRYVKFATMRKRKGQANAAPTLISRYHFLDEAFHTATSNIISHDIVKAFRTPSRLEKTAANLLILGTQLPDNTLSATVPVMFRDDSIYMPSVYKMMRSKLFNLDHKEALHWMSQCYASETESLHLSKSCLDKTRQSGIEYLSDLDYLWPQNKELKQMSKATIARSIHRNKQALANFIRSQNF